MLFTLLSASASVSLLLAAFLALREPLLRRYRARTLQMMGLVLTALLLCPWRPALLPSVPVSEPKPLALVNRTAPGAATEVDAATIEAPTDAPVPDMKADGTETPASPDAWLLTVFRAHWQAWLLGVWLFGVAVSLSVRMIRHARFSRLIRRWRRPLDGPALDALRTECARLGMKQLPAWRAPLIMSPTVVGLLRPTLLMPETELPGEQLPLVLRHELYHVKARDLWSKALVELALCMHWFNPLLLWARRQLSLLCELACDEAALRGQDERGRILYFQAMLGALSGGMRLPISTRFDGGVKNMKFRMTRLFDARPRKLGLMVVVCVLALALCTGNVLAVSERGTSEWDERLPADMFGEAGVQMSDEDFAFVMGIQTPDMQGMTLADWQEYLRPNLERLRNIFKNHATENRFINMLQYDIQDLIQGPGERCSVSEYVSTSRNRADGPEQFLSLYYVVNWKITGSSAVTVGERNQWIEGVRQTLFDELCSKSLSGAQAADIRHAVRQRMNQLQEQYTTDNAHLFLSMSSLDIDDVEPTNDIPDADFDYLLTFAVPGYLDMSVEAFNQFLVPSQHKIQQILSANYSSHWFVLTLRNSLATVETTPKANSASWYISQAGKDLAFEYGFSWYIPDPSAITVGERDRRYWQLMDRVMQQENRIAPTGQLLDDMTAQMAQFCKDACKDLSDDKMELTSTVARFFYDEA